MALQFAQSGTETVSPKDLIGSVQRSLSILELIADHTSGINVKEISLRLGLNLSTCYHLLNTLVNSGYIVKHPDFSTYFLTSKIDIPKYNSVRPSRLAELISPYIKSVREETNETTYTSIWNGDQIYIAGKEESPLSVRVQPLNIGFCEANHATALGKAILAYWDEAHLRKFFSKHPLVAFTEKTLTTEASVFAELAQVRRLGYSQDNEENLIDVFCIGAPIFDVNHKAIASLAIALPGSRYKKFCGRFLPVILNAAKGASNLLQILNISSLVDE